VNRLCAWVVFRENLQYKLGICSFIFVCYIFWPPYPVRFCKWAFVVFIFACYISCQPYLVTFCNETSSFAALLCVTYPAHRIPWDVAIKLGIFCFIFACYISCPPHLVTFCTETWVFVVLFCVLHILPTVSREILQYRLGIRCFTFACYTSCPPTYLHLLWLTILDLRKNYELWNFPPFNRYIKVMPLALCFQTAASSACCGVCNYTLWRLHMRIYVLM
jgi:hypothetical protein